MIALVSKGKLYFSRNYNPRLAVAVARFLNAPVDFEFASPFSPGQRDKFIRLNPNLSVPILVEGEKTLWEADAIACRLSQLMKSDFWPMGDSLPEIIRWISWGYWNFVRACDQVHFERVTKQRYAIGPVRQEVVQSGLNEFASSAAILEQHLHAGDWLVGDRVTYADFRRLCPAVCGPRGPAARRISACGSLACAADGYPRLARSVCRAGGARAAANPDRRRVTSRNVGPNSAWRSTLLRPLRFELGIFRGDLITGHVRVFAKYRLGVHARRPISP